jgi:ADP-ribose pyrophosphatase
MSSKFEKVEETVAYEGRIVDLVVGRFRHEDGETVTREWARHPGAAAIVAHDGVSVWLVRQPREPIGVPDLLELPAGKLDEPGESPLECAKRELAEEIGKTAATWEHLTTYYATVGFSDEVIHLYLATDLGDAPGQAIADERIDIELHPLAGLDLLIPEIQDSKTLIGLLLLRDRLR